MVTLGADQTANQVGTPLPPGTVSYSNSWGGAVSSACSPSVPAAGQAPSLVESGSYVKLTANIPETVFDGSPETYLVQTYALYPNGTLVAKDGVGNELSMRPLEGLPSGNVATTLSANSTFALERYVDIGGGKTLANVTVTYGLRYQYCQPAGLEMTIDGTADWADQNSGVLSVNLGRAPNVVNGERASFANSSTGTSIAFDWSDSASMSPSFNAADNSVSWKVGSAFTIDPTIVATSSGASATQYDTQSHVFDNRNGLDWVFYSNGNNTLWRTSTNGSTWSSPNTLYSGAAYGYLISEWMDGSNNVYYCRTDYSHLNYVYERDGTANSNGSITWNHPEVAVNPSGYDEQDCSVYASSPTNIWVSWQDYSSCCGGLTVSSAQLARCTTSCGTASNWSTKLSIGLGCCGGNYAIGFPVGLSTTSKLAFVYSNWNAAAYSVYVTTTSDGGSTWSTAVAAPTTFELIASQVTAIGDTVEFAGVDGAGHVGYWNYPLGGSMSSETVIDTSVSSPNVAIATDGKSEIALIYGSTSSGSQTLYYEVSSGSATSPSFGPRQILTTVTSMSQFSLNADVQISSSIAAVIETEGASSPYNVRFASFPVVVPTAANSGKSWSAAGLSPYEQYFQDLTEYVSPGNGLLTVEEGDLGLPGRGIDLAITRVYSQPYGFRSGSPYQYDNYTGANLGNGWSLNFPWLGANNLHLTDGETFPYDWNGSSFIYHGAANFDLVHNMGGTYTLFMPSGIQYGYASNESLLSITDRTGNNTISFDYASGQISKITDTIGRTVTFSYNGDHQLSSISSGGRTWSYGYLSNDLVNSTDPLGRVTKYYYNEGVNKWLLTGITYPTLGNATWAYGNAPVGTEVNTYYVVSIDNYASSSSASLSSSTSIDYKVVNGGVVWSNSTISNGSTNQAHEDFNALGTGNATRTYDENGTGAIDQITENYYDASGRLNETKMLSADNTLLAYSTSLYDNWGNLVESRNLVGDQTWFSYANTNSQNTFGTSGFSNSSFYTSLTVSSNIHDALVGEASFQNGSGSTAMETYYKYSSAGNLLETKQLNASSWLHTDYTYDSYGNQITTTDALGRTTHTHYSSTYSHAYPTLTSIMVGATNVTSSRTYSSSTGNLLSQTDPNSHTTSYTYDALNRLESSTYPAIGGTSATETYAYNDTHDILTITDPDGNVVKQNYDGLGRLTSVQRYNGSSLYSTQSYTYNWDNLVASNTTAAGSTYSYTYDQSGRLVKTTNPGGSTMTTSYDDVNDIKTVTNENGHETKYTYNWVGLLTGVKEYYKTGAYNTTSYQYDLTGNLVKETDPNGKVTSYQYNGLNLLTKTTYPDGTYESKRYDNVTSLLSLTNPNDTTISYAHDALNRLTTITYPGSATVSYTYDNAGNMLTKTDSGSTDYYAYDAMNRVTNETDHISGSNYQVLYTYDKASNILSVKYPDSSTDTFTYDALNRVSSMDGAVVNFTYTADNKLNTITYGNGVQTTYGYNNRDMPTSIVAKSGSTKEMDLNYTYDGVGNVLSINNENYTYDWLNQVSTAAGPWGSISYNYDGAGNIVSITQNSVETTYGYATYNRLTSVGSSTLTYDANGNLIELVNGSSTWQYSYDYENRLTGVTKNSVTVQTNTYDSDGRRVKTVQGGQTTVFIYEGTNLIYEKNTGSGAVDKYYYANGMLLKEACECGYSYYYLNDALGSVRHVMQGSSNTLFSSDYKPFGLNYQKDGQAYFQFSGKPVDGSTGLYYFGARFYNPAIQRFITEDTFPGIKEDPQSLNRYAYVENNPLSRTDPSGNCQVVYACMRAQPPPTPSPAPAPSSCFPYACAGTGQPAPAPSPASPPPAPSPTPTCSHCITNAPNGSPGSGAFQTSTAPSETSNGPLITLPEVGSALIAAELADIGIALLLDAVPIALLTGPLAPVTLVGVGAAAAFFLAASGAVAFYTISKGTDATPPEALRETEEGVADFFSSIFGAG
jgi:RHS repeat-associated protein